MGAPVRRRASEKNFLVVPLHFFGFKSTISRFSGCIRDGQYSLVSFLFCCFSTHGAPPYPVPFVKVGARAPVPYGVDATGCNTFFKWSAPLTKFWAGWLMCVGFSWYLVSTCVPQTRTRVRKLKFSCAEFRLTVRNRRVRPSHEMRSIPSGMTSSCSRFDADLQGGPKKVSQLNKKSYWITLNSLDEIRSSTVILSVGIKYSVRDLLFWRQ